MRNSFILRRSTLSTLSCLMLLATNAVIADKKHAAKEHTQPNAESLGPVARAAMQRGIKRCLPRIDQVSGFAAQSGQLGVFFFNSLSNADSRLFSPSLEVLSTEGSWYASTTYVPANNDSCDVVYESVNWWPTSCPDVSAKVFAQFKVAGPLLKNIQILDGGPLVRVFLMPAGTGCVSIKKETVF